MSGIPKHHCKYMSNPRYELKQLLISLRKANDISEKEMASKIGISACMLQEYERHPKTIDRYEAIYIETLKEYVVLARHQALSFEEALKIYMNQRVLYKNNISCNITLFGTILFGNLHINMDALEEKEAVTELPTVESVPDYHVWSEERYNTAFTMLKMLREMLEVEIHSISEPLNISSSFVSDLERCRKNYKTMLQNPRELARLYSNLLTRELAKRNVKADVYKIICDLVENGCARNLDGLQIRHILLEEIYK